MKCRKCGINNPINVNKCIYCGASLTQSNNPKVKHRNINNQQRNIQRKNSNTSKKQRNQTDNIIIGVIAALVAVLLIMGGIYAFNSMPKKGGFSGGGGGGGIASSATYKVTFDLNYEGSPEPPKAQQVKSGEKADEPDIPLRNNYAFVAWYIDKDFSKAFDFVNDTVKSNMVLYARWLDISNETDTDGDGLIDPLEDFFGSDIKVIDTDEDGLNDYIEVAVLSLSPIKKDTDGDAITDSNEDTDEDGLSNIEEVSVGSSPATPYSDKDSLTDSEEVKTYLTSPVKEDTDSDKVNDDKEIEIGTDPLVAQASFKVNYVADTGASNVKASVKIDLKGSQVDTLSINTTEKNGLFPVNIPGYIGEAYDFNVDGKFSSAEISFEFDKSLLNESNFDPVIYYYNEKTQMLEELSTTVIDNVATATVNHFSTYILLNRTVFQSAFTWEDNWTSNKYTGVDLVMVIDDSGSMSKNDTKNERISVAKTLLDGLPENSKIGLVRFESDVEKLTETLLSDKESIKNYLTTSYFHSSGDTYMYTAIDKAFSLFDTKDDERMRMVVVLSDGQAFDRDMHNQIIEEANREDIKIYTVGLGGSTEYFGNYLKPLAINSGGIFYLASNASELANIYKDINKKIDIETDTDGDGVPDYYEMNLVVFNGTKYLMDKDNPDTDGDGLTDGEEVELKYEYNKDKTKVKVIGKVNSNPSRMYSDHDIYSDYDEIHRYKTDPMRKNVVIDDDYVKALVDNSSYYASSYKDRYENSKLLRISIWIGNNIYGDNRNEIFIYKKALTEFFEKQSKEDESCQGNEAAKDLALQYIDFLGILTEEILDNADEKLYDSTEQALLDLDKKINVIHQNIIDLGPQTADMSQEVLDRIDELNTELSKAMQQSDSLNESFKKAKGFFGEKNGLKIVNNALGKTLQAVDLGIYILDFVKPSYEAWKSYSKLTDCVATIKSQIHILDAIITYVDNESLVNAAKSVKIVTQSEYLAKTQAVGEAIMGTGTVALEKAIDVALDMLIPGKFWVDVAFSLTDMAIPVSASSKEGLTLYGIGKISDAVSIDLTKYLSSSKQNNANGKLIYLLYEERALEGVKRFKSLAEIRIFGENRMIKLQDLGFGWFKEFRKFLGTDYEAIIKDCNETISIVNGFKNIYVCN